MKLKRTVIIAVFAIIAVFLPGCGEASPPEPGALSPAQIGSSMVGQVLTVNGKIISIVHNPGGLGGVYLELGGGGGEVGVRIQPDIWEPLGEKEQAQFKEGKTVTVEGVLFQAGRQLVIIHGKATP